MGKAAFISVCKSHPSGTHVAGPGVTALCSGLSIKEANIELLWLFRGIPEHDLPVGFLEERKVRDGLPFDLRMGLKECWSRLKIALENFILY